mmetsp:Transcript_13156/g.35127  ORF Transcript_13156/g.35127 Transcript_13156/m.35127 type:complete len:282 (+) Transcript_13156:157-1002(+)
MALLVGGGSPAAAPPVAPGHAHAVCELLLPPLLGRGLGVHLGDGLGLHRRGGKGTLEFPAILAQLDHVHEHEAQARRQPLVRLAQVVHANEVLVDVLARALVVDVLANGHEQLAQTLHLLLLGIGNVPEQLDEALVHDLLGEHALLVQLADEADVAKRALLGLGHGVRRLLVGKAVQVDVLLRLELLLAAVEQEALEGDGLCARVALGGRELGKALRAGDAEVCVHAAKGGLGEGLVEDELDHQREVGRRLHGHRAELVPDLLELLRRDLVEEARRLSLQH